MGKGKEPRESFLYRLDRLLLTYFQALSDWFQLKFNMSCYVFGSISSLVAALLYGKATLMSPGMLSPLALITLVSGILSLCFLLLSLVGLILDKIWQKNLLSKSAMPAIISPQTRVGILAWLPGGLVAIYASYLTPPLGFLLWFGVALASFGPIGIYLYSCTPKPPSLFKAKSGWALEGAS
jgi:hypothetical protein